MIAQHAHNHLTPDMIFLIGVWIGFVLSAAGMLYFWWRYDHKKCSEVATYSAPSDLWMTPDQWIDWELKKVRA